MLVLSRQRDEELIVGDDIVVTVVDIRGDKVRLGITAPKEVSVHRREVYDAIRRENRAAAQVKPEDLAPLENCQRVEGHFDQRENLERVPPASKPDGYVPGKGCRK